MMMMRRKTLIVTDQVVSCAICLYACNAMSGTKRALVYQGLPVIIILVSDSGSESARNSYAGGTRYRFPWAHRGFSVRLDLALLVLVLGSWSSSSYGGERCTVPGNQNDQSRSKYDQLVVAPPGFATAFQYQYRGQTVDAA
eukprot:268272-Rhodomonas_salina.2